MNGRIFGVANDMTVDATNLVLYRCNIGYYLSGDQIRRCSRKGVLTKTKPTCKIWLQ